LEFIQTGAFIVDVQVHKIVQYKNGKHEDKPHTKYPILNNSGASFEWSKWLAPLGKTIKHFKQYWIFGIVKTGSDRTWYHQKKMSIVIFLHGEIVIKKFIFPHLGVWL
jgi:hypothetical protein